MESSLAISAQQSIRYKDSFLIGNIIKYQPLAPVPSEVLGKPEKTLCVWIEPPIGEPKLMEIQGGWSVAELQQRIGREFSMECQYLTLSNRTLHFKDKISDCDILEESTLVIRNNFVQRFAVSIVLKEIDFKVIDVNVDQTIGIKQVKEKISKEVRMRADSIRLFLDNQEIDSEKTFTDLGIYSDCTLYMKYAQIKGFRDGTKVRLRNNRQEEIQKISKDQYVLVVKPEKQISQTRRYRCIEHFCSKIPVKIQLADKRILQCTEGIFFYTKQSGWVICSYQQVPCLEIDNQIMMASRQFVKVTNICYGSNFHAINMTNLLLEDYQGYSANEIIVSPALSLQVLRHLNINRKEYFVVEAHERMTVADLKNIIFRRKNIPLNEQYLYIENKQTLLKDSLTIPSIYNDNLVIQLFSKAYDLRSRIQVEKNINFIFDFQTKKLPFSSIMKRTCYQVIIQFFKEKVQEIPFFGVLLNLQLVNIDKRLEEIINMESQAFYYESFDFIVIKFPQKFILSDFLKNYHVEDTNNVVQKGFKLFTSFFTRNPYSVTDRYKSNQFRLQMKEVLHNLHRSHKTEAHVPIYQYISSLIFELSKRPNHYQKCYRAMPIENELKFQQIFTKDKIITIREFLSCCPEKKPLQQLVKDEYYCILEIESITGRLLSSNDKKNRQVVFLPYTYFIVNQIEKNGDKWHARLLEMPSPMTLSKNIILWVDDQPANNPKYIQSNLNFQPSKVEIIQITSTAMAKRWFMQFGWIVNRLKLQMRVITDMVRKQANPLGQVNNNFQAGIDLIQWLFNTVGFTTPVLVFCKDYKMGQQNLKKRGIREDRFSQVTNRLDVMHRYINFSKLASDN